MASQVKDLTTTVEDMLRLAALERLQAPPAKVAAPRKVVPRKKRVRKPKAVQVAAPATGVLRCVTPGDCWTPRIGDGTNGTITQARCEAHGGKVQRVKD